MTDDIARLLDEAAMRCNTRAFIDDDPVQFPHRFNSLPDIEIAALLCATIAWGKRTMICRNCEKMLSLMDYQPLEYLLDDGFEDLPDEINIHRTFFAANLKHYLRGLKRIYSRHGSLQEFARHHKIADTEAPAWTLVSAMQNELCIANDGRNDCRCLPQNLDNTALKRVNMALRWLVRDDRIVDLGVWDVISPARLFIPLDVHVANISRQLGLLLRKSNDRKAVIELTDNLRRLRPDDPVYYDYALFGLGIGIVN